MSETAELIKLEKHAETDGATFFRFNANEVGSKWKTLDVTLPEASSYASAMFIDKMEKICATPGQDCYFSQIILGSVHWMSNVRLHPRESHFFVL